MKKIVMLDRKGRKNLGARTTCKALKKIFSLYDVKVIATFDNDIPGSNIDKGLSPIEMGRDIIKKSRNSDVLENLVKNIQNSDAVVINGEGSMIFSKNEREELKFYLAMLYVAKSMGKATCYINAVCSPDADGKVNEKTMAYVKEAMDYIDYIILRDPISYEFAKNITDKAKYIPEALFYWKSYFEGKGIHGLIGESFHVFPEDEFTEVKYNFEEPYICISNSFPILDNEPGRRIEGYIKLVKEYKKWGYNVYFLEVGDETYIRNLGRETNCPVVHYNVNSMLQAQFLMNAKILVSGRFHPSVLASLGGTPCIMQMSNSHKSQAMYRYFDVYHDKTVLAGNMDDREINTILDQSIKYLGNEMLRAEIKARAWQLGEISKNLYLGFLDVL